MKKTKIGIEKQKIDIFMIFNMAFLILLVAITVFPFYNVLIISFGRYEDITKQALYLFPKTIDLQAYKVVLSDHTIPSAFLVTILVTVFGTLYNMMLSVTAGYALSKKSLPGRNTILNLIIFTMFFSGGLIPYYLLMKNLHMVNSLLSMILPVGINTFYMIILKNGFSTVPAGIEESAKIDGANDIYILFRIVLPVTAPIIATITLFYSVDRWNEWWNALLFISDPHKFPIQIVLRDMIINMDMLISQGNGQSIAESKRNIFPESIRMATVVITTVPVLLVYPYLQKHFAKGIMIGSIKG